MIKSYIWPALLSVGLVGAVMATPLYALKQANERANQANAAYIKVSQEFKTYKDQIKARADQAVRDLALEQKRLDADKQAALKEKDRAIEDLRHRVSDLSEQLRQRAQRPAEHQAHYAGDSQAPAQLHCTAAQLYREDAQFLVGEAAAADELRTELAQCHADLTAAALASERLRVEALFFDAKSN